MSYSCLFVIRRKKKLKKHNKFDKSIGIIKWKNQNTLTPFDVNNYFIIINYKKHVRSVSHIFVGLMVKNYHKCNLKIHFN